MSLPASEHELAVRELVARAWRAHLPASSLCAILPLELASSLTYVLTGRARKLVSLLVERSDLVAMFLLTALVELGVSSAGCVICMVPDL